MMTSIVFDHREHALIESFKLITGPCEHVDVKSLDIGDIQFLYQDEPVFVLERKTIADLAQSVKDNRYRDQKMRQLAFRSNNPKVKLVYILEGPFKYDPIFKCQNIDSRVLSGCIVNSVFRDNIFIISTKDVQDTAHFLKCVFDRFNKDPQKYIKEYDCVKTCEYNLQLASSVKTTKRGNIDQKACLVMQLACIPGISSKKAHDIIDTFQVSSVSELVDKLRSQPMEVFNIVGVGKKLGDAVLTFLGVKK